MNWIEAAVISVLAVLFIVFVVLPSIWKHHKQSKPVKKWRVTPKVTVVHAKKPHDEED